MAGNRAGLVGKRSGLWYQYLRVVRELRPTWVLIENVPGFLSSDEGNDFEIVVQGLAKCGYGVAWRVLDSQHWGVPQRRRRVFIVGHLGSPCPIEILFESEGGCGDSEAGAEAGKEIANSVRASTGSRGTDDPDRYPAYIPERGTCVPTRPRWDGDTETFIPECVRPLVGGGNDRHDESQSTYIVEQGDEGNIVYGPTNRAGGRDWHELERARAVNPSNATNGGSSGIIVSPTLRASDPTAPRGPDGRRRDGGPSSGDKVPIVAQPVAQTLLGPSGYDGSPDPDRHSLVVGPAPDADGVREAPGIPGRLDTATPDGHRYAALGDAVTVPVIEWIGRRILATPEGTNGKYGATG